MIGKGNGFVIGDSVSQIRLQTGRTEGTPVIPLLFRFNLINEEGNPGARGGSYNSDKNIYQSYVPMKALRRNDDPMKICHWYQPQ